MDTKSTNSKAYIFTKVIALLLVVLVLGFSAMQMAKSYVSYERRVNIGYYLIEDVLRGSDEESVFGTFLFESEFTDYLTELSNIVYKYGSGTKEDFNEAGVQNSYETYKQRLLYNLYYGIDMCMDDDAVEKLLTLVESDIVSLTLIDEDVTPYEGYDLHLADYDTDGIIHDYCWQEYYEGSWLISNSEAFAKAQKYKADMLLNMESYEFYNMDDEHIGGFAGGTYAVKVNDEKLKLSLVELGVLDFENYEQFVSGYKKAVTMLNTNYKNINYIYKDSKGKIISNLKNPKEISVRDYDYMLEGSSDFMTDICGHVYTVIADEDDIVAYKLDDTANVYYEISAYHTTTTESVTKATTAPIDGDDTAFDTTAYDPDIYDVKLKVADMENDSFCIFFNNNATFGNMSVSQMKDAMTYAHSLVVNIIFYAVISFICLALVTLLLIALCGRKYKGDTEVHFPFSDRVFFEIKTVLNLGLIVGIFLISVNAVDDFGRSGLNLMYLGVAIISLPTMALLLIDYVLYIARHIKAQKFLSSFFVVWFVKVLCGNSFKVIKKLWHSAAKFVKAFFSFIFIPVRKLKEALSSDKLFYAKNVEQTVKIKTAILLAANVPFAFLCFCFIFFFDGLDDLGELFILGIAALPALALDVLALIKGLSFVGGVSRIADVIKEYRKGNLDTPINRAGLPSYLIPVGENLEGLGEGIKLAVNEAVKQETTKTELITNISHDLKTPLTSIINYVDLLKKCDIQDKTALSYLDVLGEKSDRLKNLITDLVEASKAATGNIDVNLVNISLQEILTQLIGEFNDAFSEINLDVILNVPESDIIVSADNKLLYRVLENLAINVKKYSMPSTRVYISAERKGDKGIITVKNISNAPLNISPEELKQRFVRGDTARATDGNGLGLSIAENLCTVQGGTLDLDIVGDLFIAKVELNCK